MENAELVKALREDAEWAHANEWETPLTLGDHLDAGADAIESADAKMHEQDLRIADLVAHLNAEQAKVARMAAEIERLKTDFDAAAADIKHNDNCNVCKYAKYDGACDESDFDCKTCKNACPCATCRNESNWQWRGHKEAGEGVK